MISYLIDGALLVAVIAAGIGIALLYRQLRRLRQYHKQYQRIFAETGYAVGAIDTAIRDINAHGAQILLSLGQRIDEAYKAIDEIDERMAAMAEHFEAERQAASNVVQLSSLLGGNAARYADPRQARLDASERDEDTRRSGDYHEQTPPHRNERPVQWPTLEDRFSQWRGSEERGRKAVNAAGRWR